MQYRLLDEGPFDTKAEAKRYARTQIGAPWILKHYPGGWFILVPNKSIDVSISANQLGVPNRLCCVCRQGVTAVVILERGKENHKVCHTCLWNMVKDLLLMQRKHT